MFPVSIVEEVEEGPVIEGDIGGMLVIAHTEGLVAGEFLFVGHPVCFSLSIQRAGSWFLNCGQNFLVFTPPFHAATVYLAIRLQSWWMHSIFFYSSYFFVLLYDTKHKITCTNIHYQ